MTNGMRLVLMGIAIGLAGAFALTRSITSLLFGVSATDPLTFVVIPLLLALIAMLDADTARQATKVDRLYCCVTGDPKCGVRSGVML